MTQNDFKYRYSAPSAEERKEIESIRNSYMTDKKTDEKLVLLRKMDGKVKNLPQIAGIALGVFGLLVFGVGMTMILQWNIAIWGVVVCVVGLVPMLFAHPAYKRLQKHLTQKYGEQIINLSNELLGENNAKESQ